MTTTKQSGASWSEVKTKLADLDRAALLALVHDLYAAGKDNQSFMHARFGLGGGVLKPSKATISRWLWPDGFRNQNTSVGKAKKAIADYKKANGDPGGLAELMTFYCEQASGFGADVGMDDEAYLGALVRMFEQALKASAVLGESHRAELRSRLDVVRRRCHNIGYGVGDDMDRLWAERGSDA
jgi:hypothetical protein